MKSQFLLNPNITFLNHGSYGACAKPIFENYQYWQLELEKEPIQFNTKKYYTYLKQSKLSLSLYLGCNEEDIYFTPNPTTAVNTIMRSLSFKKGDEILSTNCEYGAMDIIWDFYFRKTGVKYVKSNIKLPVIEKEFFLSEFWKGYSENTKAIFISHVSCITSLIQPLKEICKKARELGLLIIIDGAHVPGHIPLNINKLNPDFYIGTCHKWMLTPKGCSFLYVKKDKQNILEPLVIGWGYGSQENVENYFLECHQREGARDNAAYLTIPSALHFFNKYNWEEKSLLCKQLILDNYESLCSLLNSKPLCPISSEFLGQMCTIPINTNYPLELKELLYSKYKIEIPIIHSNGKTYMRVSLTPYNSQSDLDILRSALINIIDSTKMIIID